MNHEKIYSAVVAKLGSQAKLARVLGKHESTVSYWRRSGIPAEIAVSLEKATNGLVPRWLCRPDLWDHPKPGKR